MFHQQGAAPTTYYYFVNHIATYEVFWAAR